MTKIARRFPAFQANAALDRVIRGEVTIDPAIVGYGFPDGSRLVYSHAGGGGWRILFPGQTDPKAPACAEDPV